VHWRICVAFAIVCANVGLSNVWQKRGDGERARIMGGISQLASRKTLVKERTLLQRQAFAIVEQPFVKGIIRCTWDNRRGTLERFVA